MNGYYAPDKFSAVLDYVREQKQAQSITFNDFYRKQKQKNKGLTTQDELLHTESFITKNKNLADVFKHSNKPMLILFEQSQCQECSELHGDVFRRLPVYKQLQQFTIVQVNINSPSILTTPEGKTMTEQEFARSLGIQYTPSMVFYGTKEDNKTIVFRSEAYLKGFHIQALFDYVLTQAYINEPEFQRFVQRHADELSEQGKDVNLWE
jgi:thioredoxin-related protein